MGSLSAPAFPNIFHAKIPLDRLSLTTIQHNQIQDIYAGRLETTYIFVPDNEQHQYYANDFLRGQGLDRQSRDILERRWNVQWSNNWRIDKGSDRRWRYLFQCSSGYDTVSRNTTECQKKNTKNHMKSTGRAWKRRNPYDFTGCLAHAEVTERESDGAVSQIVGYFEHNLECQQSVLKRLPAVPLHPHVYELALAQLSTGASLAAIQSHNLSMIERGAYHDMKAQDTATANHRYHFLPRDAGTLYRMYNKAQGVDTTRRPEYNVNDWLDPQSPHFRADINRCVFYYKARMNKEDRLKVCISTAEMDDAAWKYAHQGQLILDGTFGICSSRLLLFIAMGIDKAGKGLPLALFLFSAPAGNSATHAGYNTTILRELLDQWAKHLSKRSPHSDSTFSPCVAITDTDTKERAALQDVWPSIWLLLCKFHVRQCWTNRRKSQKFLSSKDGNVSFWNQHIHGRLQDLEVRLLDTIDHKTALRLIEDERANITTIAKQGSGSEAAASRGIAFLDYMVSTWMPESLWQGWSRKGRTVAAALLKIPIEGILPTTNHLESFNCLLKRKYIPRWQRSGVRIRFDFLIHIFVSRILPEIYSLRRSQGQYLTWLSDRFRECAGGVDLVKLAGEGKSTESERATSAGIYWFEANSSRDGEAVVIVNLGRIYDVRASQNLEQVEATCASASANLSDPNHTKYELLMHQSGIASCTCLDFKMRGGACKHLRALHLVVFTWAQNGVIQHFHHPTTLHEAQGLQAKLTTSPVQCDVNANSASLLNNLFALKELGNDDPTADEHEGSDSDGGVDEKSDRSWESDGSSVMLQDMQARHVIPFSQQKLIIYDVQDLISIGRNAVPTQREQRIQRTVSALLPRLHNLLQLLSDTTTLSKTPDLTEFQDVASSLAGRLRTVLVGSQSTAAILDNRSSPSAPQIRRTPPSFPIILPPSPELRQKRKTSHDTM